MRIGHAEMAVKRASEKTKCFWPAAKDAKNVSGRPVCPCLDTGSADAPLQIRAMREYAATRGWTIAMQVKEVGSGASERELRQKLIEAARRREIDVVLVWRLDRWGRSLPNLVTTLEELNHLGVGFVSLTEALDLTTPTGRAMAGLLSVFAAFEHEILKERCPRRARSCPPERKAFRPPCNSRREINRNPKAASRRRQQSRDCAKAEYRPHLCSPHPRQCPFRLCRIKHNRKEIRRACVVSRAKHQSPTLEGHQ